MLVDEVEILIQAGHGGPGKVSFHAKQGAGPNGGDGGRGGDVYAQATTDMYALTKYLSQPRCEAENGEAGGNNNKTGAHGKDAVLVVPIGTSLIDQDGKEIEITDVNNPILLVKGGLGGRGNAFFKSPSRTTPRYAQPGLPGDKKRVICKLKLIADFGLIGLPNAGKSSLINELTNANAKIGDYAFTTLEPNLGVMNGKVLADIPGLIEGASEGKGLGHKFLKHIEKVTLLLHCISCESEDPLGDYKIVHKELEKYNPALLEKQEIVLLTKSDLAEAKEIEKKRKILLKTKKEVISISIHDLDNLQILIKKLTKI